VVLSRREQHDWMLIIRCMATGDSMYNLKYLFRGQSIHHRFRRIRDQCLRKSSGMLDHISDRRIHPSRLDARAKSLMRAGYL
jgi:hypothetical protein